MKFIKAATSVALATTLLSACGEAPAATFESSDHALTRAEAITGRNTSQWRDFLVAIPELADGSAQIGAMAVGEDVLFIGLNTARGSAIYRSDRDDAIARFAGDWVDSLAVGDTDDDGVQEAYFALDTRDGVTVRRSDRGLDEGAEIMRPDPRRAHRGLAIGDADGDGSSELLAAFATSEGGAVSLSRDGHRLDGYVWGPHGQVAIDSLAVRAVRGQADEVFMGLQTRGGAELWRGNLERLARTRIAGPTRGASYTAMAAFDVGEADRALLTALATADGTQVSLSVDGRSAGTQLNDAPYQTGVLAIAASADELLLAFDDANCTVGINPEPKLHGLGINPEPKLHPAGVNPEPKVHPAGVNPEPKAGVCINPEPKLAGINPEPKIHVGINPEPKIHR